MAAAHALFDRRLPFHFWSYPPPALFLAAPLGRLPYFPGLAAWTAFNLLMLWPAVRAFFRQAGPPLPRAGLAALAFLGPATSANIGLGQNGGLTAGLLLGGLSLVERRPWAAGAVLGLLVFKPQIGLLLPVMVLAGGRWRTAAGAAASAAALLLASALVFGLEPWRLWLSETLRMQQLMLAHGRGPFQWMMPSAFMAGRLLGLAEGPALLLQAPFTLAAAWMTWRAWRSPEVPPLVRGAVLALATFVASPQAFNYDLIPALAAAALLWRLEGGWRGWSAAGRGLCLATWTLPVSMIAMQYWRVPLAPVLLCATAWRLCVAGGVRLLPTAGAGAALRDPAGPAEPPPAGSRR